MHFIDGETFGRSKGTGEEIGRKVGKLCLVSAPLTSIRPQRTFHRDWNKRIWRRSSHKACGALRHSASQTDETLICSKCWIYSAGNTGGTVLVNCATDARLWTHKKNVWSRKLCKITAINVCYKYTDLLLLLRYQN